MQRVDACAAAQPPRSTRMHVTGATLPKWSFFRRSSMHPLSLALDAPLPPVSGTEASFLQQMQQFSI